MLQKPQPYPGRIRTVTLGTGDERICLGGETVLPFYTFDGTIPNRPAIGVEISDAAGQWDIPGIQGFYQDCETMAQRAKRAEAIGDFLCLNFECADPNGENRSVESCVADAVAVAAVVKKPIVVMGCKNLNKDGLLLPAIAKALQGKNIALLSARSEDYQTVGTAVALDCGQKLGAETADDINLAKQLNILLRSQSIPQDSVLMNVGTAAVGYGYEYVASTLDRVRLAALEQGDEDLQMPVIAPVSSETWSVKESAASIEEEPAWGDREERGISMEIVTAVAELTGGANAVILRHPAAIAAVRELVENLLSEGDG